MPPRTVLALLGADRRRLGRDGLLAWVAALPLVMAVAVRAGLLWLAGALEGHGIMIGPWLPQLRAVALAVVVPVLVGVVVGFMLLEEKQDRVWAALAVTEVSLRRYLAWRAATCLTAAALVTFACLRIAGPAGLGVGRTAWAAVGAAPLAGAVALGLAAWARDTIQGFAAVKLLLVVLVLPAAAPALAAPWRNLLVLVPSWWILRAVEATGGAGGGGCTGCAAHGGHWPLLVLGSIVVNLLVMGAAVAGVGRGAARPERA